MYVSRDTVLSALPKNREEYVIISRWQDVPLIIQEMTESYSEFEQYYDKIYQFFEGATIAETCDNLYDFCVTQLRYKEETDKWQSVCPPQGIIDRGHCDCKGYASIIGGVLGAIARATGEPIDWTFYFASYRLDEEMPYHVFVEVVCDEGVIWVDPTPGADGKEPKYSWKEKPVGLVAGINPHGELVYERKGETVGAVLSASDVPPSAIPLPLGYPAGIPAPYITGGKIKFTPVPPNFTPTDEQVAYMMLALQMWVNTYSSAPYSVFNWREHTDGSGSSIANWVIGYCENFGSYEMSQIDKPLFPSPFSGYASGTASLTTQDIQNARNLMLRSIRDFDFGNPPAPFTPSALDTIMDTIAIGVLKVVSNLLPVIGPVYANMWISMYSQDAANAASVQQGVVTDAGKILQQQAAAAAANAGSGIGKYLLVGVALLAAWWAWENDLL